MPKEGTIREDGLVYWRFRKSRNCHIWLTPEKYEQYCAKRKKYREMCVAAYHKRQSELPENERNYFGKYDWKKNKYFVGISTAGKEVWYYKQRFENLVQRKDQYRLKYLKKVNSIPKSNLKVGDRNPDNPEEYVTHFTGKIPRFGSLEKLELSNQSRKASYKKINRRYRKERQEKLKWLSNKRKRGEVNAEGKIFWEYDRIAKEVWLSPEVFKVKHQDQLERRRRNRLAAKEMKKVEN